MPMVQPAAHAAEIAAAAEASALPPGREDIAAILTEVLKSLDGDMAAPTMRLYKELNGLAEYIHNARAELAAIRADEINDTHIPRATDELDAVVDATASATNKIMDAAEKIENFSQTASEADRETLNEIVTQIYESCSFQDITGQRITKVVKTLKTIEAKVTRILAAFGESTGAAAAVKAEPEAPSLMNGPALPGQAMDQDEIDKLLAGF